MRTLLRPPRLGAGLLLAGTVAAASALSGCSSSSTPSASSSSSSSSSTTSSRSSGGGAASCSDVPASEVNSALGTTVGDPSSTVNGPVTVCTYKSTSPVATVIVRFQTGMTQSSFTSDRSQFDQHGEPTQSVSGIGDAAYSSSIGSGQYTNNTLVVLKGSTELLVTAPASLAQVQALAQQILPKL
ncbi:MAG TPA: hypothetical protein VE991_13790 [Acidimicrobiales bacterium]|nr:hypothetical protein [Acidimicrobiales bacterium]